MKLGLGKLGLGLICLLFVFTAYADKIVITVEPEEVKAVEGIVLDAQEWLQAAWDGKANNCIDKIVYQEIGKNPNKLTKQEKKDLIKNTDFKSRKEKEK